MAPVVGAATCDADPVALMPARVVVVDDDVAARELLCEVLTGGGVEVVGEAGNGLDGVRTALELEPDVVLMDLRMPVLGGIEATQQLTEQLPCTQVVILTAYGDHESQRGAGRAGAYSYLLKDTSTKLLLEVVNQAAKFKRGLEAREKLEARETVAEP